MKISQINKVLKDISMQDKDTNFKIVEPKTTTGRLTIAQVHKEVVDLKDIVVAFIKEQRKVNAQNQKNWEEQRKVNAETNKKFEYIFDVFKRNNLK